MRVGYTSKDKLCHNMLNNSEHSTQVHTSCVKSYLTIESRTDKFCHNLLNNRMQGTNVHKRNVTTWLTTESREHNYTQYSARKEPATKNSRQLIKQNVRGINQGI